MSVGKRLRFEIFKRDGFRCVYCGRVPPDVLLEVDHIIAVANGGSCADINLITACMDCNRGKADVPLSELPHGHQETVEQRREKLEQLRAISQLSIEQAEEHERLFQIVSARWITLEGDDPEEFCKAGDHGQAIRTFVKLMPVGEIVQFLDFAWTKFGNSNERSFFKYFCGCCWRRIKWDGTPVHKEKQVSTPVE